jgi:uncharacterized protein YxjI
MEQINEKCAKFEGFIFSQNYENYDEYYGIWETDDEGVWYKEKDFIENPNPLELHFVKVDGKVLDDYEYFLRYDTDWNWLMRVKNKICQMDIVYEFETTFNNMWWFCHIRTNPSAFGTIYSEAYPTELEATIDVIDKFLELNFNLISGNSVNS